MAVPTVTQRQHRTSDAKVNGGSGFLQTLFGKRADESDEPFTPDEQSRWVAAQMRATAAKLTADMRELVEQQEAKPRPVTVSVHGTHPTALLRELVHLALDLEVRKDLDHRTCIEELRPTMERFSRGAMAEQQAEDTFERRSGAVREAMADTVERLGEIVAAEEKANELPGVTVKAQVDTEALGSDLAAVLVNAHRPLDETAQFQRITPGMPDPRVQVSVTTVTVDKPPSPVHVPGDDVRPPVPAVGDAVEDTGTHQPLPKRVPQATTQMVLPATDLDPYEAVDPTVNGKTLAQGAWVFDEGTGTGGPVWFLLAEQANELREGVRVAVLKFANGLVREVRAGGQVKVLDVRRAQVLVAQIEARLAQRDAEVSS